MSTGTCARSSGSPTSEIIWYETTLTRLGGGGPAVGGQLAARRLGLAMLRRYALTILTEELPEGDPEDWRSSMAQALRDASRRHGVPDRNGHFTLSSMGYDPDRRRTIIRLEAEHRTGSGALEMLNTVLRQMGDHPELIAIRRAYIYPVEDEEDVLDDWARTLIDRHRFGVVLDNMGAEEWQLVEETMAADASPDSYD